MFCNQCEQAFRGKGCHEQGVCGKDPKVAALLDILTHQAKGVAFLVTEAQKLNISTAEADRFIIQALFTTVTNVDFDPARIEVWIRKGEEVRTHMAESVKKGGSAESSWPEEAKFVPPAGMDDLLKQIYVIQATTLMKTAKNEDIVSLQQLFLYGVKGVAAYAEHVYQLLENDDKTLSSFFAKALAALTDGSHTMDSLLGLVMECGKVNLHCMEILDKAHTDRYGHPEPTPVFAGIKEGPAIVVSGHDLVVLEELLKQSEGKGVNVYTHGEMLPAHGYPNLRKYQHLVGHFGTAWQNQQKEFDGTPAAFLFNTNCIQEPKDSYKDQVFTWGLVGWPDVAHVDNMDFTPVIQKALALGGFKKTEGTSLLTGFGHNAVLSVADKIVGAVKSGAIKHFLLVGGCDGAKPGRNYYTEMVEKAPNDTIILTLACGKFRFNHLDIGDIGGIPRLLDVGQCNDAYSAIKIAEALAGAFDCGVNDLPLSMVLSWYEQKAVAILLSLLSLGIKGIRLGPTLPAFISPNVLDFLVKNFDIKPNGTAEEDLAAILGQTQKEDPVLA